MGGAYQQALPMSTSSPSLTILQPYFNEILGAGNTKVAAIFIPKCTNLPVADRIEMWLKCGLVNKAGEEALKAKDRNALEELRTKASGSQQLDIDRMIAQLQKGR